MTKVLIVDDSKVPRMALRKILEPQGIVVYDAADRESALASYGRERPEVVFLDLVLGTTSGLDLLREIRATDRNVRAVVVSGNADRPTRASAIAAGAVGFIGKPFEPADVITAIGEACRGSHDARRRDPSAQTARLRR